MAGEILDRRIKDETEDNYASVDVLGNLSVRSGGYAGVNKAYEDAAFVAGSSPATHDFNGDMGRNATDGYMVCDGAGNVLVELSYDGAAWGTQFTLKNGEIITFTGMSVDSVRVTHSGVDSAYRIFLV